MSTRQIGVGVIGVGFVGGQAHAPAFRKIPNSRLVALADSAEGRVKPLAEKYGVRYYLDYKELINNSEVEAVVVAIPTPFHYKATKIALQKGKHVMCEMPLTATLEQARDLGRTAKRVGVTLMPDLNFRFTPNYVKAKELVNGGAIGDPIAVSFREFIPAKDQAAQWPAGSWAWDKKKNGGLPDYTLSVWSLDLLRWLLEAEYKEIRWKTSYTRLDQYGGTLGYSTMGLARMSNGVIAALHYGSMAPPNAGTSWLEIYGKKTYFLRADWNNLLSLTGEEGVKQEWSFTETGTRVWGHYQIDDHFIKCVRGEVEPQITVEDALKVQAAAGKMV